MSLISKLSGVDDKDPRLKELLNIISKKKESVCINGISDSNKNFITSMLIEKSQKPALIITFNDIQAKVIYDDLSFFLEGEIKLFESRPNILYNIDAGTQDIYSSRQEAIISAINGRSSIIVCSIESFLTALIPREEYIKNIHSFKVDDTVTIEEFVDKVISAGYYLTDSVKTKGQCSKKGGIVDIWPLNSDTGYRIEFFDDVIDSIRTFDAESQRSIDHKDEVSIFPARELLFTDETRSEACKRLSEDIEKSSKRISKPLMRKEFTEKFIHTIEMIQNNVHIDGIERYISYFYPHMSSILDYMPSDTLVYLDEPNRLKQRFENINFEFGEMIQSLIERGMYIEGYERILFKYEEFTASINNKPYVILNYLQQPFKDFDPQNKLMIAAKTISSFQGKISELIKQLEKNVSNNYMSFLICSTEAQAVRLIEEFQNEKLNSFLLKEENLKDEFLLENMYKNKNHIIILLGGIHKGFEYELEGFGVSVINYSDIFGNVYKRKTRNKFKNSEKLKSFTDLKPGDYVVHANHGIGIYTGIEQVVIDNITKDYLKIVYKGNDSLYVPVNQLDMLQKYLGTGDGEPKVNKLGGNEWAKVKSRVKKSVEDIAEQLIELYALRQAAKGFQFSNDTVWQTQFEEMFPYQETDDQLQSIREIKKDMENQKVMDRLLCGDVGYGKTEVAMRAAFKSVQDGKQVAYLVPTTVLAQQQYMNFVTRFKEFPVSIDMLSRFRTSAQQNETVKRVRTGEVDILIGTHRILQKDLKFKDLGLIIVDEEQRFGVKHKESLKEIKKNVDVLTLTATPIPRTLHMSMIGIRDISVIEEPPRERFPVQTYVLEYDDELIKDAIIRELARNGQVFYVYNRVETIEECAAKLNRLLPDSRICVAHGQMSPNQIEDRIMQFLSGEYDILVCTTIIETGIDMPNVNTMIIENADRMGLSQLYQLRGRVGRSNKIAYAYFTYKKDKVLSEVAEKRLQAIKEFTEFGSGFKIALRDLEIRGAGNLLGTQQHGNMEAVGYEMYCHLLEKAIKRLKGEEVSEDIETVIDISADAYIPGTYIKDELQKIEMYKKVAAIESDGDVMLIQEEFTDRFGDMPPSVDSLIKIAYIKHLASNIFVDSITQKNTVLFIQFTDGDKFDFETFNKLQNSSEFRINLDPKNNKPMIRLYLNNSKPDDILKSLTKFLKSFQKQT